MNLIVTIAAPLSFSLASGILRRKKTRRTRTIQFRSVSFPVSPDTQLFQKFSEMNRLPIFISISRPNSAVKASTLCFHCLRSRLPWYQIPAQYIDRSSFRNTNFIDVIFLCLRTINQRATIGAVAPSLRYRIPHRTSCDQMVAYSEV